MNHKQMISVLDALQICFDGNKAVKLEIDGNVEPHFGHIRGLSNSGITVEYDDSVINYQVGEITDVLYF